MLLDDVKTLHDAAVATVVTSAGGRTLQARDYDRLFDAAFSLSDFIVNASGDATIDPQDLRRRSNIYTVKKVLTVLRARDVRIEDSGFSLASRVPGRYQEALNDLLSDFKVDGMLEVAARPQRCAPAW